MTESYLTSKEIEEQYNINRTLMYAWFDALEAVGLARRAPGRVWGTKLFSPESAEFLLTRKGKVGAPGPGWSKDICVGTWLEGRQNV